MHSVLAVDLLGVPGRRWPRIPDLVHAIHRMRCWLCLAGDHQGAGVERGGRPFGCDRPLGHVVLWRRSRAARIRRSECDGSCVK